MKSPTITKKNNPNQSGVRRIIGVDPGLASTGWGVVEIQGQRIIHIAHGSIETEAHFTRPERLFIIYSQFKSLLSRYEPIEEGAVETLYFSKNISSALPVAESRGVVCMAMAERGILVREFTPLAIKQAVVGRGTAGKSQVQELVRLILGLESIPKPDHAADALGAALCSAHTPIFIDV